ARRAGSWLLAAEGAQPRGPAPAAGGLHRAKLGVELGIASGGIAELGVEFLLGFAQLRAAGLERGLGCGMSLLQPLALGLQFRADLLGVRGFVQLLVRQGLGGLEQSLDLT